MDLFQRVLICGRFFDAEGQECNSRWRNRAISIEPEYLRKIPQVTGVAAGPERAPAVAAAMRGGLLKSLLIDDLIDESRNNQARI